MIKTVKRTEININVGDYFPNASDLEAKYGLNDASENGDDNSPPPVAAGTKSTDELAAYKRKIQEKNKKIESLCVLLEALEPLPNMNPVKYKQLIDGDLDENIDFRDSKIVSLAKKSHNLTALLNKEKREKEELNQTLQILGQKNVMLTDQLAAAKSAKQPDIKPYGRNQQANDEKEDRQQLLSLQKEVREYAKQTEDLKRRLTQQTEENRNLSRALDRELGDGVTVEQAVDGGWRGRAQHIVMLKSKIKKLEQAALESNNGSSSGSTVRNAGITGRQPNPNDVDVKAQGDIQYMGNERRRIVEALTEERESLMATNADLEKKNQAFKARINNLESDTRKLKENLQFVLDKSATDDELLEALKEEVARTKSQLAKVQQQQQQTGGTVRRELQPMGGGGAAELREEQLQSEIKRLQRLCKNQSDQIESQDQTIRQLKKNFNL